jgi:hypothetical protein
MDSQEIVDTYVIMWSPRGLESIINMTHHQRQYLVMLLKDDPNANLIGNPMRSMIVEAVLKKHKGPYHIWQVDSSFTQEEIVREFEKCPTSTIKEIVTTGIEIYSTV